MALRHAVSMSDPPRRSVAVNTPLTLSTLELYTLVIFRLDCNQIGSILGWSVPRLVLFQIGQLSDWTYGRLDLKHLDLFCNKLEYQLSLILSSPIIALKA